MSEPCVNSRRNPRRVHFAENDSGVEVYASPLPATGGRTSKQTRESKPSNLSSTDGGVQNTIG